VTADTGAEQRAFQQFMTPTPGQPPTAPSGGSGRGGNHAGGVSGSSLTADVSDGKAQAAALGHAGMPVYFPRLIADQSRYCTNGTCTIGPVPNSYPRAYSLSAAGGGSYRAYRMTLVINPALGQYYGVQGTTWQHPPILSSPTETRDVNGKQLSLYFNGHKLSLVAWHTPQAVYWISNTLTDDLSNQQMVGIAASLTRA
jgi:hypothetical protein